MKFYHQINSYLKETKHHLRDRLSFWFIIQALRFVLLVDHGCFGRRQATSGARSTFLKRPVPRLKAHLKNFTTARQ